MLYTMIADGIVVVRWNDKYEEKGRRVVPSLLLLLLLLLLVMPVVAANEGTEVSWAELYEGGTVVVVVVVVAVVARSLGGDVDLPIPNRNVNNLVHKYGKVVLDEQEVIDLLSLLLVGCGWLEVLLVLAVPVVFVVGVVVVLVTPPLGAASSSHSLT